MFCEPKDNINVKRIFLKMSEHMSNLSDILKKSWTSFLGHLAYQTDILQSTDIYDQSLYPHIQSVPMY